MKKSELIKELNAIEGDFEVVFLFPEYPTERDEDGFVENFLEGDIYHVRKAKLLYNIESDVPKIFLDPQ